MWFQGVITETAQLDAWCIIFEHLGGDVEQLVGQGGIIAPFHAPKVPSYPTAVILGRVKGIQITSVQTVVRPVKLLEGISWTLRNQAEVVLSINPALTFSAAMSRHPEYPGVVAKGLAYRNAVHRLLFPGRHASSTIYGKDIEK